MKRPKPKGANLLDKLGSLFQMSQLRAVSLVQSLKADLYKGLHDIQVNFSSFELYNEKAFDLLHERNLIPIKKIGNEVMLQGLSCATIDSSAEFEKALEVVMRNRTMGETSYNINSSRSHTFFQIQIKSYFVEDGRLSRPKLLRLS